MIIGIVLYVMVAACFVFQTLDDNEDAIRTVGLLFIAALWLPMALGALVAVAIDAASARRA